MTMIVILAALRYCLLRAKCCSDGLITIYSFSIHNNPMDNITLTLTQKNEAEKKNDLPKVTHPVIYTWKLPIVA